MTSENSRASDTEIDHALLKDDEKGGGSERFFGFLSERAPTRRVVTIGLVAVLVVLAGCGGDSSNGTPTAADGTIDGQPTETDLTTDTGPPTETGTGETAMTAVETTTATSAMTTTGAASTTAANMTSDVTPANASETEGSMDSNTDANSTDGTPSTSPAATEAALNSSSRDAGLDLVVEPRTANTSNVTLLISAAIGPESATDGIENITVDTGTGLDVSELAVADVETAGIDEGSTQSGSATDGSSLGANAEGTIESPEEGEGFRIPLDGTRSIDDSDELVVVIEGGIATTEPGNYTFSVGINDAPAYEDSYNVTAG